MQIAEIELEIVVSPTMVAVVENARHKPHVEWLTVRQCV